jgi:formate/nitrite transporter FocA (FNT family)
MFTQEFDLLLEINILLTESLLELLYLTQALCQGLFGSNQLFVCCCQICRSFSHSLFQLITGAVFPVGLIITVLTGAELFTGDAMLAPMAAFIHKISWMQVLNLWVMVYIGNLIGSLWLGYIMAYGPCTSWNPAGAATVTAFGMRAITIAAAKVQYVGTAAMWSAFLKGIGCNWLVNLAILLGNTDVAHVLEQL